MHINIHAHIQLNHIIHHSQHPPNTWAIMTQDKLCNAPRHESYMHAVPSLTMFRPSPMMQQKHHNRRQYGYKIHHHQSCMHEHMTQQQCICSHILITNNHLQYYTCNHHISTSTFCMHKFNTSQPTTYMSCYNSST